MIYTCLTVIVLATLVTTLPIERSRIHLKNDIVLVPFDVQYMPVGHNPMWNNKRESTSINTNQKHLATVKSQTEERSPVKDIATSHDGLSENRISKVEEFSSVSRKHDVVKRQAPGNNNFLGIRYRAGNRRIRFHRLPAFVGYLTDNDDFPTVA